MKLQSNFDVIIRFLAQNIDPESLADKLFASRLISHSLVEEVGVSAITKSKRIRLLMNAMLSLVELNSEKYREFMNILEAIEGLDELVALLQ